MDRQLLHDDFFEEVFLILEGGSDCNCDEPMDNLECCVNPSSSQDNIDFEDTDPEADFLIDDEETDDDIIDELLIQAERDAEDAEREEINEERGLKDYMRHSDL